MIIEWILSIIFAWLYVTAVHEIWHIITFPMYDLKFKGFYPFWHWHNLLTGEYKWWRPWEFWKDPYKGSGKFYFARYECAYKENSWDLLRGRGKLIDIAPLVGDTIRVGLLVVLLIVFGFNVPILISLAVASMIDVFVWLYGFQFGDSLCDGKRYKNGRF